MSLVGRAERRRRRRQVGLAALLVLVVSGAVAPVGAQTTQPVLWSVSNSGAGNGVRIASDAASNVVVVSGDANLVVTSFTSAGAFRWSSVIPLGPGTLRANWVATAPNGDFVVAGSRVDSHGTPYEAIVARYSNSGAQLWRHDIPTGGGLYGCVVGRLVVDGAGNAYLVGSFVGPSVDATILKYDPNGALLWWSKDLLIANSVAVAPNGSDVMVTGFVPGSFSVRTAAHDAATGAVEWFVNSPEAGGGRDLVVDDMRVYVTGQGVTNPGTPSMAYHLTVIAYDRATGARQWRVDSRPPAPSQAAGYWIALAPDGSLAAAGPASASSYLNWWIVALDRNGTLKWQAARDRAVTGDEIPAALFVLQDGTTVVSGVGGPTVSSPTGGVYLQGVTAAYGPTGAALWEGFAPVALSWAIPLATGAVVGTGGLNALTTAWNPPGSLTGVPEASETGALRIERVTPNPARSRIDMVVAAPGNSPPEVQVLDVAGRLVAETASLPIGPGRFSAGWDLRRPGGGRAAPGVYMIRVRTGTNVMTGRFVIVGD